jgi:hypothetical protein
LPEPLPKIDSTFSPDIEPIEIFNLESNANSESDCAYTGRVNYYSDSEYEPGLDNCWSDSDGGSLVELEGDELEDNLQELEQSLSNTLAAPLKYDLIAGAKSSEEWQRAEQKRGFGYTGTQSSIMQKQYMKG